jgi:hypothetical protein
MTVQLDLMRVDQRPWLNVKSISMESFEADKYLCAKIIVENTGTTQATITSWGSMPWIVEDAQEFMNGMRTQHQGVRQPTTMKMGLGPGGTTEFFVYSHKPLTSEDLKDLQAAKLTAFVVGEIVYSDLSGKTHHTRWCSGYAADDKRFVPSGYGNDMD